MKFKLRFLLAMFVGFTFFQKSFAVKKFDYYGNVLEGQAVTVFFESIKVAKRQVDRNLLCDVLSNPRVMSFPKNYGTDLNKDNGKANYQLYRILKEAIEEYEGTNYTKAHKQLINSTLWNTDLKPTGEAKDVVFAKLLELKEKIEKGKDKIKNKTIDFEYQGGGGGGSDMKLLADEAIKTLSDEAAVKGEDSIFKLVLDEDVIANLDLTEAGLVAGQINSTIVSIEDAIKDALGISGGKAKLTAQQKADLDGVPKLRTDLEVASKKIAQQENDYKKDLLDYRTEIAKEKGLLQEEIKAHKLEYRTKLTELEEKGALTTGAQENMIKDLKSKLEELKKESEEKVIEMNKNLVALNESNLIQNGKEYKAKAVDLLEDADAEVDFKFKQFKLSLSMFVSLVKKLKPTMTNFDQMLLNTDSETKKIGKNITTFKALDLITKVKELNPDMTSGVSPSDKKFIATINANRASWKDINIRGSALTEELSPTTILKEISTQQTYVDEQYTLLRKYIEFAENMKFNKILAAKSDSNLSAWTIAPVDVEMILYWVSQKSLYFRKLNKVKAGAEEFEWKDGFSDEKRLTNCKLYSLESGYDNTSFDDLADKAKDIVAGAAVFENVSNHIKTGMLGNADFKRLDHAGFNAILAVLKAEIATRIQWFADNCKDAENFNEEVKLENVQRNLLDFETIDKQLMLLNVDHKTLNIDELKDSISRQIQYHKAHKKALITETELLVIFNDAKIAYQGTIIAGFKDITGDDVDVTKYCKPVFFNTKRELTRLSDKFTNFTGLSKDVSNFKNYETIKTIIKSFEEFRFIYNFVKGECYKTLAALDFVAFDYLVKDVLTPQLKFCELSENLVLKDFTHKPGTDEELAAISNEIVKRLKNSTFVGNVATDVSADDEILSALMNSLDLQKVFKNEFNHITEKMSKIVHAYLFGQNKEDEEFITSLKSGLEMFRKIKNAKAKFEISSGFGSKIEEIGKNCHNLFSFLSELQSNLFFEINPSSLENVKTLIPKHYTVDINQNTVTEKDTEIKQIATFASDGSLESGWLKNEHFFAMKAELFNIPGGNNYDMRIADELSNIKTAEELDKIVKIDVEDVLFTQEVKNALQALNTVSKTEDLKDFLGVKSVKKYFLKNPKGTVANCLADLEVVVDMANDTGEKFNLEVRTDLKTFLTNNDVAKLAGAHLEQLLALAEGNACVGFVYNPKYAGLKEAGLFAVRGKVFEELAKLEGTRDDISLYQELVEYNILEILNTFALSQSVALGTDMNSLHEIKLGGKSLNLAKEFSENFKVLNDILLNISTKPFAGEFAADKDANHKALATVLSLLPKIVSDVKLEQGDNFTKCYEDMVDTIKNHLVIVVDPNDSNKIVVQKLSADPVPKIYLWNCIADKRVYCQWNTDVTAGHIWAGGEYANGWKLTNNYIATQGNAFEINLLVPSAIFIDPGESTSYDLIFKHVVAKIYGKITGAGDTTTINLAHRIFLSNFVKIKESLSKKAGDLNNETPSISNLQLIDGGEVGVLEIENNQATVETNVKSAYQYLVDLSDIADIYYNLGNIEMNNENIGKLHNIFTGLDNVLSSLNFTFEDKETHDRNQGNKAKKKNEEIIKNFLTHLMPEWFAFNSETKEFVKKTAATNWKELAILDEKGDLKVDCALMTGKIHKMLPMINDDGVINIEQVDSLKFQNSEDMLNFLKSAKLVSIEFPSIEENKNAVLLKASKRDLDAEDLATTLKVANGNKDLNADELADIKKIIKNNGYLGFLYIDDGINKVASMKDFEDLKAYSYGKLLEIGGTWKNDFGLKNDEIAKKWVQDNFYQILKGLAYFFNCAPNDSGESIFEIDESYTETEKQKEITYGKFLTNFVKDFINISTEDANLLFTNKYRNDFLFIHLLNHIVGKVKLKKGVDYNEKFENINAGLKDNVFYLENGATFGLFEETNNFKQSYNLIRDKKFRVIPGGKDVFKNDSLVLEDFINNKTEDTVVNSKSTDEKQLKRVMWAPNNKDEFDLMMEGMAAHLMSLSKIETNKGMINAGLGDNLEAAVTLDKITKENRKDFLTQIATLKDTFNLFEKDLKTYEINYKNIQVEVAKQTYVFKFDKSGDDVKSIKGYKWLYLFTQLAELYNELNAKNTTKIFVQDFTRKDAADGSEDEKGYVDGVVGFYHWARVFHKYYAYTGGLDQLAIKYEEVNKDKEIFDKKTNDGAIEGFDISNWASLANSPLNNITATIDSFTNLTGELAKIGITKSKIELTKIVTKFLASKKVDWAVVSGPDVDEKSKNNVKNINEWLKVDLKKEVCKILSAEYLKKFEIGSEVVEVQSEIKDDIKFAKVGVEKTFKTYGKDAKNEKLQDNTKSPSKYAEELIKEITNVFATLRNGMFKAILDKFEKPAEGLLIRDAAAGKLFVNTFTNVAVTAKQEDYVADQTKLATDLKLVFDNLVTNKANYMTFAELKIIDSKVAVDHAGFVDAFKAWHEVFVVADQKNKLAEWTELQKLTEKAGAEWGATGEFAKFADTGLAKMKFVLKPKNTELADFRKVLNTKVAEKGLFDDPADDMNKLEFLKQFYLLLDKETDGTEFVKDIFNYVAAIETSNPDTTIYTAWFKLAKGYSALVSRVKLKDDLDKVIKTNMLAMLKAKLENLAMSKHAKKNTSFKEAAEDSITEGSVGTGNDGLVKLALKFVKKAEATEFKALYNAMIGHATIKTIDKLVSAISGVVPKKSEIAAVLASMKTEIIAENFWGLVKTSAVVSAELKTLLDYNGTGDDDEAEEANIAAWRKYAKGDDSEENKKLFKEAEKAGIITEIGNALETKLTENLGAGGYNVFTTRAEASLGEADSILNKVKAFLNTKTKNDLVKIVVSNPEAISTAIKANLAIPTKAEITALKADFITKLKAVKNTVGTGLLLAETDIKVDNVVDLNVKAIIGHTINDGTLADGLKAAWLYLTGLVDDETAVKAAATARINCNQEKANAIATAIKTKVDAEQAEQQALIDQNAADKLADVSFQDAIAANTVTVALKGLEEAKSKGFFDEYWKALSVLDETLKAKNYELKSTGEPFKEIEQLPSSIENIFSEYDFDGKVNKYQNLIDKLKETVRTKKK